MYLSRCLERNKNSGSLMEIMKQLFPWEVQVAAITWCIVWAFSLPQIQQFCLLTCPASGRFDWSSIEALFPGRTGNLIFYHKWCFYCGPFLDIRVNDLSTVLLFLIEVLGDHFGHTFNFIMQNLSYYFLVSMTDSFNSLLVFTM